MRGRLFAIQQGKAKQAALAEFGNPLASLDATAIRRLRFRVIRSACMAIVVGAGLVGLVIWSSGSSMPMARGYGGNGLMLAFVGGIYLFCWGVYRLCTIRNGMAKLRQDELLGKFWHIL